MDNLVIDTTTENFSTWIGKEFLSKDLKNELSKKDILITPIESFRDYDHPVFPVGTEELFNYLKSNLDNNSVDVCIDDEDYEELALHSDLIIVGSFVVTTVLLPVLVNLISSYIQERWMKKAEKDTTKIKVELTVVDENKGSKKFKYEGPSKEFKETLNSVVDSDQKELNE